MKPPHRLRPMRAAHSEVPATGGQWNRRRFICTCAALLAPALSAQSSDNGSEAFRGGKVEWARLRNPGQYWNRHAESDPELLDFIRRNTTLNIDTTWRAASAKTLPDLCNYPFLFTDRVENLSVAEGNNLAEYLKRGGFLFIDCCCNTGINPSADAYLANQTNFMNRTLPGVRITPLPDDHEVYSVYFKMARHPPRIMASTTWMCTRPIPLHGISLGDRRIGILSMSGLQCGWAHVDSPAIAQECLEMMTNIYLYIMMS